MEQNNHNGKIAIFGSGNYGMNALLEYGLDRIACFIDNDVKKQGWEIEGIPVVSLDEYKNTYWKVPIYIATASLREVSEQLESEGIKDYYLYLPTWKNYYDKTVLVLNPYEKEGEESPNETDWNKKSLMNPTIDYINRCVSLLKKEKLLFNHVEIETYNRCNGGCEFCPVSVQNEMRLEKKMDKELFCKIISQLREMNYRGRLALFSNNEPFLDDRIIEFHKYARRELPNVRMHLYTNGTLLTIEKFKEIISCLDELIIDNYNQNLELIPSVVGIKEYCETHPELIEKVTIVLRKPKEILTSRGGDAPNRKEKLSYAQDSCMLPYRQLIIRPDGKVSLCCNDPLGKTTMGDLNKDTIIDVWYGEIFQNAREKIVKGRENYGKCKYCDTFIVG